MTFMRPMLVGFSGFVAGIAFVLACGDSTSLPDAGRDAMAQIPANSVYHIESRTSAPSGSADDVARLSIAQCNPGDVLLGGGCWIYAPNSQIADQAYDFKYPLVASGPIPKPPMGEAVTNKNQYACFYKNPFNEAPDMIVVATAICYDVQP